MNTNQASLGQSTVQTYSTTEKSGFERAVFALECTARWLDNGSDPAQAAEQIRLSIAQIKGCIADCDVHPADARQPAAIDKQEAVYREVGVWEPGGSKFRTYSKENLNGKAMFVMEAGTPAQTVEPVKPHSTLVTFDEFVQYGKDNGANIVNGMPWSFIFNGHAVTHETDDCYLIGTPSIAFRRGEVLLATAFGDARIVQVLIPPNAARLDKGAVDAVSDDDLVLVSRDLLGAACSAIDKKRDAPATLAALRAITFAPLDKGDSKPVVPSAEVVMEARRFRWIAHDHDHPEDRDVVRRITENMSVKSYSALCRDIDAAIADSVLRENGCAAPLDRGGSEPVVRPYERHDPENATAPFLSFIPDAKRDELIGALLADLEKSDQRETDFFMVRSFIGGLGLLAANHAPASPSVEQDERKVVAPVTVDRTHKNQAYVTLGFGSEDECSDFLRSLNDLYARKEARAASTSANNALFARVTDWVNLHRIPFEAQNELFRILAASPQPVEQTEQSEAPVLVLCDSPKDMTATIWRWRTSWGGWTYRKELPAGWRNLPSIQAYRISSAPQPVEQTGDPVAWRIEQRAGRYTFVEHVENLKLYAGANIVPLFRAFRSVDSNLNTALDRLESMVTWEPRLLDGADAIDRLENINRLLYELLNPHPTAVAQPVEQTRALTEDAGDAARYRLLRRGQHWSVINGIGDTLRGEDLDAAIDAALTAAQSASGDAK
jgi:hypothetical protein